MIETVIIDDEPNNIANLERLLAQYCPGVQVVGTAAAATAGKDLLLKADPDLVFLDISMPDRTGFDLLRSLPEPRFDVIFVTAYDQYGIQAVKFSALDYLLKPIDIDELCRAVAKARSRHQGRERNRQLENLMDVLQNSREEHRIALPGTRETRFVKTSKIIRCESSNNYTTFYLAGRETILVSKPIFEYEELLSGYGFVRTHKSHLINKSFVRSWMKEDGGYLVMEDGASVPVSRHRKETVRRAIECG